MKTKRRTFRQFIKAAFIALVTFGIQSCETEIPPEDITPPEFSFQINGDGFYHVFDQDSDYDNIRLELKAGATYDFTYTVFDEGGLAGAYWSREDVWKIRTTFRGQPLWSNYYGHNGIYGSINWSGDRSNPVSGATVTGFFEVRDEGYDTTSFTFSAVDFGGDDEMLNRIQKRLRVRISDGPTRILR
ncbi:hypothetical protein FEE95_21265 [Maribacter algarum]|uniref:Uncharacterized protein n=1 Tax=Maribacter algarum (ex Zhang et al. 2020) TaxID=2578118 RepID=A0A5S3PG64_9FLAO|nr:hypothetical protein [Maribacter algarum]TMM52219.1 hypothetical protein FEE95_21265 [Maribacter algarum]